ncbi:MAG TPA: hypothetical protein DEB15_09980 [Pusillimonas sp.]|jgi:hypothetical protein|nr:hypothetical protein [Pusillimonas sp.]MBC41904.1 hypothetical protein [Pusillimonas sp.]HBT33126.1 hypothetical protein [Pusillimonas sp.]HCN72169.1 hypothetical protein [Pusillimonas sp.]HCP79206.1 hypothetical protein [Pusillimonas sp.]|tara:strand:- start:20328 stop:20714 length:387 start_codon:yes stop_codon:yes gene_type:complete
MTSTKRIGILTLALSGVFSLAGANAQTQTPEQRYQQELRQCEQLSPTVDMQACKREAGAALQATRQGNLKNNNGMNYDSNKTGRCASLPANQRDECMMQMSGQNTRTMGSVEEGGILRETTITVPATQ